MPSAKRPSHVLLKLDPTVLGLIAQGFRAAAAGEANAAILTNPNPTPAQILSTTQGLESANIAAGTRAKGLVDARDIKERGLRTMLEAWGAYLTNMAASLPGQEAYVYECGGFGQKKAPKRLQKELTLTQPGGPGTAHARCKAAPRGKHAFYGWRLSLDGGKTWIVSQTNDAHTDFANIPAGTEIQVEYNMTIKNVTTNWSTAATLIVK